MKTKRRALIFLSLLIFISALEISAQSRRDATVTEVPKKVNRRDKPAEPPPPKSTPSPDENTTNISTVKPNVSNDQTPASTEPVDEKDVIRVDTELVTIPVKVSDRGGRFAAGLKKENFKVLEDGKEQEIAYFSNEEEPFTVVLVLDMSYSSNFKIAEIQAAAIAFTTQLHPNDKVMVVSFDEEVHVLCEPTTDRKAMQAAIKGTEIGSGTSLYEAIDYVINKRLKKMTGRKAIVLFTDGVDTTSHRASDISNLSDAYELDALIYPIEYNTFNDVQAMKNRPITAGGKQSSPGVFIPDMPQAKTSPLPFPMPTGGIGTASGQGTTAEDYRKADEYLQGLANRTSGRVYPASTTANLATAFTNIAGELRQIYSLGFYPGEGPQGKRRKLKVKVDQAGLSVQARDSYVVGTKPTKK